MDITPAIEQVVENHKRALISNGFKVKGKTFDEALFVDWIREKALEQRNIYFDSKPVKNPYSVDIFKLAYLIRFVIPMCCSTSRLVQCWPEKHFTNWIKKHEHIGICSIGSGPGSDVFSTIYALNNKVSNWDKKIQYIIRREKVATWEHFYQNLKKEIIATGEPQNRKHFDDDLNELEVENETLQKTLQLCHDEWICNSSGKWTQAYCYSKCNIISLQHVLSDPTATDKNKDNFDEIVNILMRILKYSQKPTILLVSDRKGSFMRKKIVSLREKISEKYKVTDILSLREFSDTHVGISIPEYLTKFGFQAKYNHQQAIWEVEK